MEGVSSMNVDVFHKWDILEVIFKQFQDQVYFSFIWKYEKNSKKYFQVVSL